MVSPTLECMQTCMSPCATCSSTDPSSCTSCISGFTYNTDATQNCQPNLDCNTNGTCTNCPFGFALKIDTVNFVSSCTQCSNNCARCNPTSGNEGVCLSCFEGPTASSASTQHLASLAPQDLSPDKLPLNNQVISLPTWG